MKIVFGFIFLFCAGCASMRTKSQDGQLRELLKSYNKEAVSGLRFDGVYSFYDTVRDYGGSRLIDQYDYIGPIIFFANGLLVQYRATNDSLAMVRNVQSLVHKERHRDLEVAAFKVQKDTLNVVGSFLFDINGHHVRHFIAHFRGILKNTDTIMSYRMIPPYPKGVLSDLSYFRKPRMLVFKPLPGKTRIDSNAIWINRLRVQDQQAR